jgi:ribonuclease HI
MADETRDDNSVSRVMNRAREAGFRKFVVVNLYAYVSTDPRGLLDSWEDADGPLGPDNLSTIAEVLEEADYVLCAWGSEYIGPKQAARVLDMIGKAALTPHCLGLTDDGSPVHPARLRADTTAIAWDQEKVRKTIREVPEANEGSLAGENDQDMISPVFNQTTGLDPGDGLQQQQERSESVKTVVWTDGSCNAKGMHGRGGWAALIEHAGTVREISGSAYDTTHNRMELTAICEALETLTGAIEVRTDSAYVEKCFNQNWHERWLCDGSWRGSNGPVKNRDLWERLFGLVWDGTRAVTFKWIKGHDSDGDLNNHRVDRLAQAAALSAG